MSIPVTCLEIGANIRGIRKKGVQVIKQSIMDVGFSKSSFIKCYEVKEEEEQEGAEADKSVLDLVKEDEALKSLHAHKRWFEEDMEVTRK